MVDDYYYAPAYYGYAPSYYRPRVYGGGYGYRPYRAAYYGGYGYRPYRAYYGGGYGYARRAYVRSYYRPHW